MTQLETEISEKLSLMESLPTSDQTYAEVNTSVMELRERLQTIRDEIVTLNARKSQFSDSMEKCTAELEKFSGVPRKSNTVQVARAQSEQSEVSDVPQKQKSKRR